MVYKFFEKTICFQIWLHRGNRPPGMLSIWMACEARLSKTTHGDGGVVICCGTLVGRDIIFRRNIIAMGSAICWCSQIFSFCLWRHDLIPFGWFLSFFAMLVSYARSIFFALGNKSGAFVRQWIDRKAIKRGCFFLRCWFHFMDNYMYFISSRSILWITICILLHGCNDLYLDTICFISWSI